MTVSSAVPDRPILIIFNPVAGWRRRRKLNAALDAFRALGVPVEVHETRWPKDAADVARTADSRYRAVVSGGGDGTINEVINGLMARAAAGGHALPLGILPLGTANVLAAELGLPVDPPGAAAVIAAGVTGEIRLGMVNDRYFALMVGAGFDAYVVSRVKRWLKRWFGKGAYIWETMVRLVVYPAGLYRVVIDGQESMVASVVVARSRFYGGRFVLAQAAHLRRPDLQVCLFERPGRRSAMQYMVAMLFGRLDRVEGFRIVTATRLSIGGAVDAPVQADGDIIATLPLEISVAPRTLTVILSQPPEAGADTAA